MKKEKNFMKKLLIAKRDIMERLKFTTFLGRVWFNITEKIDISARNLSGIELGYYFPKAETLEKILKALNISLEEMFSNDHLQDKSELIKEINLYLNNFNQNKIEYIYKIVKFLNFE